MSDRFGSNGGSIAPSRTGRSRRILLLATHPSEGLLTEPTAGAQVGRRELELSPNFGDGLRVQAATVRD